MALVISLIPVSLRLSMTETSRVDRDGDAPPWIVEVWTAVIEAAEAGEPLQARIHGALQMGGIGDRLAVTRVTLSTPRLLDATREYQEAEGKMRPFNFMICAHTAPMGLPDNVDPDHFQLMAPFESDPRKWSGLTWVNREPTRYRSAGWAERQHLLEAKAAAEAVWLTLRRRVIALGGIRPTRDHSGRMIPRAVVRRGGVTLEEAALRLEWPDGQPPLTGSGLLKYLQDAYQRRCTTQRDAAFAKPTELPPGHRFLVRPSGWSDMGEDQPPDVVRVHTIESVARAHPTHPEAKALAQDGSAVGPATRGLLRRPSITAGRIRYIGKEAHHLEEREGGLIHDPAAAVAEYKAPGDALWGLAIAVLRRYPRDYVAAEAELEGSHLRHILGGSRKAGPKVRAKLIRVAANLARAAMGDDSLSDEAAICQMGHRVADDWVNPED